MSAEVAVLRRPQFTLRDVIVQLGLYSIILTLLTTRSWSFFAWIPTVVTVAILTATRGFALPGAVYGFTVGCVLALVYATFDSPPLPAGDPGMLAAYLVFGSICAWIGSAVHAIRLGRMVVGVVALGIVLLTPVVLLVIALLTFGSNVSTRRAGSDNMEQSPRAIVVRDISVDDASPCMTATDGEAG